MGVSSSSLTMGELFPLKEKKKGDNVLYPTSLTKDSYLPKSSFDI